MYRCDQQTSAENLEQQATNEAKIFLWQVCSNKLQTGVELKKRNWKYSHLCGIFGCPETVEHICFTCVLAKFTWVYFKEALGWERVLRNLQDFP